MDRQILNFTANEQILVCDNPIKISTNKVNYIEARFDLGQNWSGYDSVRAVWFNDFQCISTVLDSQGVTFVPFEVMKRKGRVKVDLVGSISEDNVLTDRLTSYPVVAVIVDCVAPITGANTQPITPSEYEQFVEAVRTDADRAEQSASDAEQSAQNAETSADNSLSYSQNAEGSALRASGYALDASDSATQAQGYAQNASESATDAENYAQDAEDARDEIRGMSANATTLPSGSDATASYSDGVLSLGIPKGDKGDKGSTGDSAGFGTVSATVDATVGTPSVEVTASGSDTAKNFAFAFHNLKGEQGEKGDTGDVNLSQLSALLPTDTASGDIASFSDGQSVIPAVSVKVDLEPIQDLHGYDKPWSGGNGDNKCDINSVVLATSEMAYGLTVTKDTTNGSITISGTPTWTTTGVKVFRLFAQAGAYSAGYTPKAFNISTNSNVTDISLQNIGSDDYVVIKCTVSTIGDVAITLKPLFYVGGTEPTTWTPYSNICPISGRTEVVTSVVGKDLLKPKYSGRTNNGVTYVVNEDGTITASGTATSTSFAAPNLSADRTKTTRLPAGTYKLSGGIDATKRLYLGGQYEDGTATPSGYDSGSGLTYNFTKPAWVYPQIVVSNGTTIDATFNIQLELGSTATAYEPYHGDTYTTDLERTVYGGTLDVVSGELTVTHEMITYDGSSDESWTISSAWGKTNTAVFYTDLIPNAYYPDYTTYKGAISNLFESATRNYIYGNDVECIGYSGSPITNPTPTVRISRATADNATDFRTFLSNTPLQFCYELATPQTYQLTPQEVQTLLGDNNIWSDGTVEVVYKADIQRWVLKQLNA